MKTYNDHHPLGCVSSARRLFNFIAYRLITNTPNDAHWAHERLFEALEIQYKIYRSIIEATKNA